MKKFLFIFLAIFAFANSQASALSCLATTLEQDVKSFEIIAHVKVKNVYPATLKDNMLINRNESYINVDVVTSWKGNLSGNVNMYNIHAWPWMSTDTMFKVGGEYIIFGSKQNGRIEIALDCAKTSVYDVNIANQINTLLKANTLEKNYCKHTNINSNLFYGNWKNNRNEVITLKQFLNNYYSTQIPVNGNFGWTTRSWVTRFQIDMGIRPSGGVGPVTRYKMNELCSEVIAGQAPDNCKSWYDGCNNCSRSYIGGPLMCTMMACIQGGTEADLMARKPFCREYFR